MKKNKSLRTPKHSAPKGKSLKDFPAAAAKMNQSEFAKLIGRDRSRVSRLYASNIISSADGWLSALHKFIHHTQEQAAGRGEGGLIRERERLAKLQADRIGLDIKRTMAELMPLDFLTEILAFQNSNLRTRTLGIPNALKVKHPEMSTPIFLSLKEITVEVLTALSHVRFPADLDERIKRYYRDCLDAAQSQTAPAPEEING